MLTIFYNCVLHTTLTFVAKRLVSRLINDLIKAVNLDKPVNSLVNNFKEEPEDSSFLTYTKLPQHAINCVLSMLLNNG
jgi:hypothetical protein